MGPAAAEKSLEITRSLIDLAKIEHGLSKPLTVCFDEWNVWDPVRAPGEKGAEEHYDLSDALAVAAWLNVFVRKADIVKIACIAQSVNVISPIITSPEGLYRQTTYFPLHLFSNLMRGSSLDVLVTTPSVDSYYTGITVPAFIRNITLHTPDLAKLTKYIDASAVLANTAQGTKEIRIAIANRSAEQEYEVPIVFGPNVAVSKTITVHEVWHEDLRATNNFGDEKVKTITKETKFGGAYKLKKHSFQILIFTVA
ncbi:glycoside hydrolase family 51 protein [Sphaerobolus stellatus SS14]|uniref:Glycoside hydrolase family 51 protein n=1 Tax=Sphaerobolus stellatus (strain SS14) TaxID=990650 RepID=A0A0C9URR5_SPHS4|nr:glycoside hydrolase family 51 protein [Sphaerobolus stellatus SS14]